MAIFRRQKTKQFLNQVSDLNSTKIFEYVKIQNWDKVRKRLNKSNRVHEVRVWVMTVADDGFSKSNLLPIHLALWKDAPFHVIKGLVLAYPESLDTKDQYGRVPLHIAVSEKCSSQVIEFILNTDPQATRVVDKNGELPLHLAMMNCSLTSNSGSDYDEMLQKQFSTIKLLVDAYPQGVYEANMDGLTPMRMAKLRCELVDDEEEDQILRIIDNGKALAETNMSSQGTETNSSTIDAADALLSAVSATWL